MQTNIIPVGNSGQFTTSNLSKNNLQNIEIIRMILKRFTDNVIGNNDNVINNFNIVKMNGIIDSLLKERLDIVGLTDETTNKLLNFKHGSVLAIINKNKEALSDDISTCTELYAKEASNFMHIMKDVITPKFKELLQLLESTVTEGKVEIGNNYNIELIGNVDLFDHLLDNSALDVIGTGELVTTNLYGFPIDGIGENIRELFITGDNTIDQLAAPYIEDLSDDDLNKFWNTYILDMSSNNSNLNEFNSIHFRKIREMVLFYCVVTRIKNGNVKYVSNQTLFERTFSDIVDFINAKIIKYINFMVASSGNLVVNYVTSDKDVKVYLNKDNYNEYIGNCDFGIDAIIGFVIKSIEENGSKIATPSTITDNGIGYREVYKKQYKIDTIHNARMSVVNTRGKMIALQNTILKIIAEIESKCSDYLLIKFNENVESELHEYISKLDGDDVYKHNKITSNILNIACNDIGKFIEDMDNFKSLTSGEDIAKETSLYAVMNRLVDKINSDLVISEVK